MGAATLILPILLALQPVAACGQPPATDVRSSKAPAPAFEPDMPVLDRGGSVIGRFKTLVESADGPMVVVEIDGKLVAVPMGTLTLRGDRIQSRQTKAEILAAARAPR